MKNKSERGPVIEQRRFEFDGHCFYVPLKIAINVRLDNTARKKLAKRRKHGAKRGKNHSLKRCRPVNYWSYPSKRDQPSNLQFLIASPAALPVRITPNMLIEAPRPLAVPSPSSMERMLQTLRRVANAIPLEIAGLGGHHG